MAHIANLMVDAPASLAVGMHNYISRDLSPCSPQDSADSSHMGEKEKYVWRMHQPAEPRKYQLFPAKDKLSIAGAQRNGEAEQSTAESAEKERSLIASALRLKKDQPIRRRKASITDLGPMTTVQEVAMDSPTIPGRPPLHERSISAPGNSWRQHVFGESMISCISGPLLDEKAEIDCTSGIQANNILGDHQPPPHFDTALPQSRSASPKQPLSPRSLAPLVIPNSTHRLAREISSSRLRSVSECNPPDVPPKSARMKECSPHPRASPYTPMSSMSSSTSLLSASTAPTSTSTTPNSALPMPSFPLSGRSSPVTKPVSGSAPITSPLSGHTRNASETPRTLTHQRSFPLHNPSHCHRRHESEASIMDRGRPKKRSPTPVDGSPIKRTPSKRSPCTTSPTTDEKSNSQKAFEHEHLPAGLRPTDAPSHLSSTEISTLRKQAIGQASRFEVLTIKDVEALSRELRALDERCEYLRKTHRSLRSGRRNLHERICTYLRSPRVAKFSGESMLRQEEALSELDTSIDDWVGKLEVAENRRMRVRQKLLEHVAAALIMEPVLLQPESMGFDLDKEREGIRHVMHMVSNSHDPNTPPRSPTKVASSNNTLPTTSTSASTSNSNTSPTRHHARNIPIPTPTILEESPLPIPFTSTPTFSTSPTQTTFLDAQSPDCSPKSTTTITRRGGRDVESIRIYADSDVYALMKDLDEEIERMACEPTSSPELQAIQEYRIADDEKFRSTSERERKEAQEFAERLSRSQARSQSLSNLTSSSNSSSTLYPPASHSQARADSQTRGAADLRSFSDRTLNSTISSNSSSSQLSQRVQESRERERASSEARIKEVEKEKKVETLTGGSLGRSAGGGLLLNAVVFEGMKVHRERSREALLRAGGK